MRRDLEEQLKTEAGNDAASSLLSVLGHVPRHPSSSMYPSNVSIWRWASRNLPGEFAGATLNYIAKVCGANTWTRSQALDHVVNTYQSRTATEPGGLRRLPVPILEGAEGRSIGVMRNLSPERFIPWRIWSISGQGARPQSIIAALDDCIHTGNTIVRLLERWRQVTSPPSGFHVHVIALAAHEEGLSNISAWAKRHGGEVLIEDLAIGRVITRFSVRDALRFPWTLIPGSEYERLSMEVPEIRDYIIDRRREGRIIENFTEDQAVSAQPHSDDLIGAVGLLLSCVKAYKVGLAQWSKTGGIRPMGYVDEKDPLQLHHELGFGSPYTSWFGVPNTAPLGLWVKVIAPSLFTRKGQSGAVHEDNFAEAPTTSDLDDLPF